MPPFLTIVVILALVVIVALVGYAAAWLLLINAGNRLTLRQLALQPGMHVIDVGCGSGRFTIPMAQQVGSTGAVLGIDIEAGKIQRAEQRMQEASIKNVRFERAGAGEGKLPHERFDRAVLFAVLGEMSDREAALAEIFQALKSGGILSITEGFLDPHYQSRERVRSLAQAVGFVEERCAGNRLLFTMNFLKPEASSRQAPHHLHQQFFPVSLLYAMTLISFREEHQGELLSSIACALHQTGHFWETLLSCSVEPLESRDACGSELIPIEPGHHTHHIHRSGNPKMLQVRFNALACGHSGGAQLSPSVRLDEWKQESNHTTLTLCGSRSCRVSGGGEMGPISPTVS